MHFDGHDLFLIANGEKVARRGRPGTPQAGTWIDLNNPNCEVINDGPDGIGFRRKPQ